MVNIKNRVVTINTATLLDNVDKSLQLLQAKLKKDLGLEIQARVSYLGKQAVLEQLRARVKNRNPDNPTFSTLLNKNDLTDNEYNTLEGYIQELKLVDFEPPLAPSISSAVDPDILIHPIPSYTPYDPRRTARLVQITDFALESSLSSPSSFYSNSQLVRWLLNNCMQFGFVPYQDLGLYYVGLEEIKRRIQSGVSVKHLLNLFISTTLEDSLISVTSDQIVGSLVTPSAPITTTQLDLDYINNLDPAVVDNNGNRPTLVLIDGKPVEERVAIQYLEMANAAQQDGITLTINSGFRPARGPVVRTISSKGKSVIFDTQESIRRDRTRWRNRNQWPGDDEDFVFNAPSSYFDPATARPDSSNHGNAIALDIKTGSRTGRYRPLREAIYQWLVNNSWKYGFIRTVSSEEWHFEYKPTQAITGPYAVLANTESNRFYQDLGLGDISV